MFDSKGGTNNGMKIITIKSNSGHDIQSGVQGDGNALYFQKS